LSLHHPLRKWWHAVSAKISENAGHHFTVLDPSNTPIALGSEKIDCQNGSCRKFQFQYGSPPDVI